MIIWLNGAFGSGKTQTAQELHSRIPGSYIFDPETVHHFTLSASPGVILSRLKSRGEGKDSWAAAQIDRCLSGLEDNIFRYHLNTEQKSITEVADSIISLLQELE